MGGPAPVAAWMPAGQARPAQRTLASGGFTSPKSLSDATESEVATLHGMGPNAMKTLKEALKARNLKLADSD